MLSFFTVILSAYIHLITRLGYWGVALAMLVENCNIPLPSELVLPFAGYLVFTGQLHFTYAVLAGVTGGVIGALISYSLGKYVATTRWGKSKKLNKSWRWFDKYGETAVLVCRFFPIVRAIISIPAGATGMNPGKFILYTFAGGLVWNTLMIAAGYCLGTEFSLISKYYHDIAWALGGILVTAATVAVIRKNNARH